jgi:hypothetical protein
MDLPTMTGRTVDGHCRSLPADLDGAPAVVILAFDRAQQRDVDAWIDELERDTRGAPHLRIVEVPLVDRMTAARRRLLASWMAAGIDDPVARDRTVTVHTDVEAVLRHLGVPDRSRVCVLVVDGDGAVRCRVRGGCAPPRRAAVVTALAELGQVPA